MEKVNLFSQQKISSYLLRSRKKLGEGHFLHPSRSFDRGILIFRPTNPKTVPILRLPYVICFVNPATVNWQAYVLINKQ